MNAEILYGAYLYQWYRGHTEGEPVCFDEFVDNELMEEDYMCDVIAGCPELIRAYEDWEAGED